MSPAQEQIPGLAPASGLEQRLVELETRLAFQEHALAELGDALAEARLERAGSDELLQAVLADLRGLRGALYADAGSEPPPPHY
ncbi:SlyX family protein [Pseudoxanthomonas kaohsiungensis]|uniref:SlyX family protein n=1 Tax=Pseudoxanthomonas kaohsiungensis TaxID=283923 RepID=UPI0035B2937F